MRHVWLRSFIVIVLGAAVLAAVLWVAATIDVRPPQVVSYRITQPLGDEERVALTTTSIEIAFSEAVDRDSAEHALRIDPRVDGTVSWSGTTLIFTPAEPLPLETAFTVFVAAGVADEAGNQMAADAEPFTFRTAGRPQILASSPDQAADGVELDVVIRITFSALMDTNSVEQALSLAPATPYDLRWSGQELQILPGRPLRPGQRYELVIDGSARDVAGVALAAGWRLTFDTLASNLEPRSVVPADGSDGIAGITPIAALFDEELDPESLAPGQLRITPGVAGSLGLDELPGAAGERPRYAVRFTPSGALPPNTTFEVELLPGVRGAAGTELAEPVAWTFTTGAPFGAISNQIVFLSDRSGVANLWAMNPDGAAARQLSAELVPVLDFAVAPDARTFVLGDGRRLILQAANGEMRRVLTDEDVIEFDPAWSPDGRTIVFGRADPATGAGLGLWTRGAEGGDERRLELPAELSPGPSPAASPPGEEPPAAVLREPAYAPDGQGLAFLEPGGVAILELPEERLTRLDLAPAGPPVWLPDSSAVLVPGRVVDEADPPALARDLVPPMELEAHDQAAGARIFLIRRSGGPLVETALGSGAYAPAVHADLRVAYLRRGGAGEAAGGRLYLAESPARPGRAFPNAADLAVTSLGLTPEARSVVVAVIDRSSGEEAGIWLLGGGEPQQLSPDGRRPRWLP